MSAGHAKTETKERATQKRKRKKKSYRRRADPAGDRRGNFSPRPNAPHHGAKGVGNPDALGALPHHN